MERGGGIGLNLVETLASRWGVRDASRGPPSGSSSTASSVWAVPAAKRHEVEIDGRRLSLSNLDKVLYPEAGFTKGHVIDYYTRVAPVLLAAPARPAADAQALPERRRRPATSTRSSARRTAPEWVDDARCSWRRRIDFCLANDLPTLVWLANLADLELHTSLALAEDYGDARP